AAEVFKVSNESSVGRLALARVFGGSLNEGSELSNGPGTAHRAGALFAVQGGQTQRLKQAQAGEVVGIAKAEAVKAGDRLGLNGVPPAARENRNPRTANFALAIGVKDHKDEVRLSTALNKLIEEDPGLTWETIDDTH